MVRTRADEIEKSSIARLDRMEIMIQDMAETLRQQQQPPPPPPLPLMPIPPPMQGNQMDDRTITLTKEFKKMKPPQFCGGLDPLKAEAWVLGIVKLFELFSCSKEQKLLLAAFTLKGEECG
ncbi:hypothetical protein ACSBR1_039438 [Camellia fascicularis]